jgi:Uma2 family endonuclease
MLRTPKLNESMTVATDDLRSVKDHRRMTLQEFLTYDDGTDTRYELEDGVLIDMGTEATINIKIVIFLIETFLKVVKRDRIGIKVMMEVRSRYATARDPDLVIHSEGSAAALEGLTEACLKYGDPNPLIAIEIVSPGSESSKNFKRDYEWKPREYADRGIAELWQINAKRDWVKVGTLTDGEYQFATYQGDDVVVSTTFPELKLTAAQVLAG